MKTYTLAAVAVAVLLIGGFLLTSGPDGPTSETETENGAQQSGAAMVAARLPEALSSNATLGKRAFDAKCAVCHGENASGQEGVAPPLIHKIYEPSHHGDQSFFLAAQNGVRAHHWPFGNMPPVDGLTRAELAGIVDYVRELQRENGIN